MTWKEFKKKVELQGVEDEDVIDMIDLSGSWSSPSNFDINVHIEPDRSVTIFSG